MQRIALLGGSSVVVTTVPPDGVALHPSAPAKRLADVPEAVREALRFPLGGAPLAELARGAREATVVIEPPALPIPGADADPRAVAIDAAVAELVRCGVALERITILVASGLQKRPTPREIGQLVLPEFRRRFRGRLVVHDAEDEALVEVAPGLRVNRALTETDLVLTVSAAESVLHGGPNLLLAGAGAEAAATEPADSLLETSGSQTWARALELERALQARVPVVGVSLALNHPLPTGALRGFPYDDAAIERLASSPMRRAFRLVPRPLQRAVIKQLPVELRPFAVFAGAPSVAHAEALLRTIEVRAAPLDEQLDAIVVPVPPTTPSLPRERPSPVSVSHLGLGLGLRLWRNRPPLRAGGTVILLHPFRRAFTVPAQQPFRSHFRDPFAPYEPDPQELDAYRRGSAAHPLLPHVEWEACRPAIRRAGAVIVAGCRDSAAARQLGFVPAHGLGAALEMARGRGGAEARIGFLVGPPYFPLLVGDA